MYAFGPLLTFVKQLITAWYDETNKPIKVSSETDVCYSNQTNFNVSKMNCFICTWKLQFCLRPVRLLSNTWWDNIM